MFWKPLGLATHSQPCLEKPPCLGQASMAGHLLGGLGCGSTTSPNFSAISLIYSSVCLPCLGRTRTVAQRERELQQRKWQEEICIWRTKNIKKKIEEKKNKELLKVKDFYEIRHLQSGQICLLGSFESTLPSKMKRSNSASELYYLKQNNLPGSQEPASWAKLLKRSITMKAFLSNLYKWWLHQYVR